MRSGLRDVSTHHRPRLLLRVAALGVLVLPVALLVPAHAVVPEPVTTGLPTASGDDLTPSEAASTALDEAEATLNGKGSLSGDGSIAGDSDLDATLALVQVQQTAHDLSTADRERAEQLFARPTDDDNRPNEISYDGLKPESLCTDHFCIHWVTTGKHAPNLKDTDQDDVPDYVETTASTMEQVWDAEIGTLGYRKPISDKLKGNPPGVDTRGLVDVYLGNTGAQQVYGYAVPEDDTSTSTSYLVLDNDFAEFPAPGAALKVTAAHEFFHSAQFAYSTMGDRWFMEATATWIEEQVYDDINDNRQFLNGSTAVKPGAPLDDADTLYANWVFFEGLSERHGPRVVRAAWHQVAGGRNSMMALNTALTSRGSALATEFALFASGSNVPELFFDEGSHYARSAVAKSFRLGPKHRSSGTRSFRQHHMSSRNFVFVPRPGSTARSRLRIRVETDAPRVRARVLVELRDHTVKRRAIRIGRSGVGRARVGFARADVSRVVLTLTNASFRYRCFEGTALTCGGTARDDHSEIAYRATFRR